MAKKRYTPETIIRKLREAEVLQGQGLTIAQVVKQLGITEQTFDRWRREYGGMRVDQAKRLKELEAENARLKRAVADLTMNMAPLFHFWGIVPGTRCGWSWLPTRPARRFNP